MMFKIFSETGHRRARIGMSRGLSVGRSVRKNAGRRILLATCALQMLGAPGCTLFQPRMPPADLQRPGWTVREGQAVWHLPHRETDLAGELLLATRGDGGTFIQFTKSPFTLVVAQSTAEKWRVEFPTQGKRFAGRGTPPKRLIWLQLPHVLTGHPPPENWSWRQNQNGWQFKNDRTGEALEGYFNQ